MMKNNVVISTTKSYKSIGSGKREITFKRKIEEEDSEEESLHSRKQKSDVLHYYQIYVKLLLGLEPQLEDELTITKVWGSFKDCDVQQQLPQAILMFPNPDHPSFQNMPSIKPIDAIEFLSTAIKGSNDLDKLLFLKAIEQVLQKLDIDLRKRPDAVFKTEIQYSFNNEKIQSLGSPLVYQQQEQIKNDANFSFMRSRRNAATPGKPSIKQSRQSISIDCQFEDNLNQMKKKKILETLALDFSKLKNSKPRRQTGGKFLQPEGDQWLRTNFETQDYMTLVRHIILIVLAKKGFHIFNYLSSDGKYIFTNLTLDEENLQKLASAKGMKKQLNLCFSDLMSFEPVDQNLRPLRLNNRLWKPQEFESSEMLNYLRPMMIDLIKSINFKKVAREVNQNGMNETIFSYGKRDFNDDDAGLTDEEWFAFYQYLVHMEKNIKIFRKDLFIDSDQSALFNDQVDPFTLFMKRNKDKEEFEGVNKGNLNQNPWVQKEYIQFLDNLNQMKRNFKSYEKKFPFVKSLKLVKQEEISLRYMNLFQESIQIGNGPNNYLQNIWDRLKAEPFEPFINYCLPDKKSSIRLKAKLMSCWRKYQITENEKLSLFSNTEQLKLAYESIMDSLSINDFIQRKVITQFYCLNDHYELFGQCPEYDKAATQSQNYYKKKIFHLQSDWKFLYQEPWKIPTDTITDYYGQKIGLYFFYLSYFTQMIAPIGMIGLLCSSIQWLIWDNNSPAYGMITIIFTCIQIQWSSLLDELWEQKQILFNLKQGQDSKESKQDYRSKFEGKYVRSTDSDQLNAIELELKLLFRKCLNSALVIFCICMIYSGMMVGLFMVSINLSQNSSMDALKGTTIEVTLTASINIILIHFFEIFYDKICTSLTDYENHKTVQDYEISFVIKRYSLEFFSYLGPMLFISFINGPSAIYCYQDNCQLHVQYHFATLIIWMFFIKVAKYAIFIFQITRIPIFQYDFTKESIRQFIQEQSTKKPFAISQEKYGTLDDYMEIFIFNTMLSMFGYSFPVSFFLVFLQSVAQLHAQRAKFLYSIQRPWPQNENTLGIWRSILKIVSLVCLLSNSGSAAIIYTRIFNSDYTIVFVFIIVSNSCCKFVFGMVFGSIPYIVEQIIRRQKYLIKSTFQTFKKSTSASNAIQAQKRYPIFKIYRAVLRQERGHFETMSSQSDLEDHYITLEDEERLRKAEKRKQERELIEQQNMAAKFVNEELKSTKMLTSSKLKNKARAIQRNTTRRKTKQLSIKVQDLQKVPEQNPQVNKQALAAQFVIEEPKVNITDVDNLSLEFLSMHFAKRLSNWGFKFFFLCPNPKIQDRIKLKYLKFLFHLELLTSYKKIWTEQRYTRRFWFLKRKQQLVRNLDWRKVLILSANQANLREIYTEQAEKRYRKQLEKLKVSVRDEDQQEYKLLTKKYNKFVEKHSWMENSKVAVLKMKGIWFNRYRVQSCKQPALKTAMDFYKKAKLIEKTQPESSVYTDFEALVDYKTLHLYDLQKVMELIQQIDLPEKKLIEVQLTSRPFNILPFYSYHLKSPEFQFICERFKETFVFDYQTQVIQEIGMQYFHEELFPVPQFKLVKYQHDETWVGLDNKDKQILVQFLKIDHLQTLKPFTKSKVNLGVYYPQANQYIRQVSIIDMIDHFENKGFCLNVYDCKGIYTLAQVIKYRMFYSIPYTNQQIIEFLNANLNLLKERSHGDININNYFLNECEYCLIQTFQQKDDLIGLAQVLLEMILLKPVQNFYEELEELKHPLKGIILVLCQKRKSIDFILDNLKIDQGQKFQEIFIDQTLLTEYIQQNQDLNDLIQELLHKLNIYLRMRNHKGFMVQYKRFENLIFQQFYRKDGNFAKCFQEYLQSSYVEFILNSDTLKIISEIILVFFMKFSSLIQQQRQFDDEINDVIGAIEILKEEFDLILNELSLNLDFQNLSAKEKNQILKRRSTITPQKGVRLSQNQRTQIIGMLRKHQSYVDVIFNYRRIFNRYLNQFHCLLAVNDYLTLNILFASQRISDCISEQIIIVINEPLPTILTEPKEITTYEFNFNQQSPRNKEWNYQELMNQAQQFNVMNYFLESPDHSNQLLFYYYLQLIILFDSRSDQFEQYYKQFEQLYLKNPIFEYFITKLEILRSKNVSKDLLDELENCQIGRYQRIQHLKWTQQYMTPLNLVFTSDVEYFWRYTMSLSFMNGSFENWRQIRKSLEYYKDDTISIMIKIRLLHHQIHIEGFNFPIISDDFRSVDLSNLLLTFDTKIKYLKQLHKDFQLSEKSWFYKESLTQLKAYHLQSICFTYSPKHPDNIEVQDSQLLQMAKIGLGVLSNNDQTYYQIVKRSQILQLDNQQFNGDDSHQLNLRYQNINSYIYILYQNEGNIRNLYEVTQNYIKVDGFQTSIFFISLINFYISIQQLEMADVFIEFCRKLINHQAPVMAGGHFGFLDDLAYLDVFVYKKLVNDLRPYNNLLIRSEPYSIVDNFDLNNQIILFNCFHSHNYEASYDAMYTLIMAIRENEQLVTFHDIAYSLLIVLNVTLGDDCEVMIRNAKEFKYKQGTLARALIDHCLGRYYINMNDYEIAHGYTKNVLNYIYSYYYYSSIIIKQSRTSSVYFNNEQIQLLNGMYHAELIDIFEQEDDLQYKYLFDDLFIQQSCLNHLDVLTRLPDANLPPTQIIFTLLQQIKQHQAYLLQIIAQYFQSSANEEGVHKISLQLLSDYSRKIRSLNRQKNKLKRVHMNKVLSNKLTPLENVKFYNDVNLIDYELMIYQSANIQLTPKQITNWSIQAAEKSIQAYCQICIQYKYETHFQISKLNILLCQNFMKIKQIKPPLDFIKEAELTMYSWYESKRHPNKGIFFYNSGLLKRWIFGIYKEFAAELKSFKQFSKAEQRLIISELLSGNPSICLSYDQYKIYGSLSLLIQELKQFIQQHQEERVFSSKVKENQNEKEEEEEDYDVLQEIVSNLPPDQFKGNDLFLAAFEIFGFFNQDNQYMTEVQAILHGQQSSQKSMRDIKRSQTIRLQSDKSIVSQKLIM